MSHIIINKLSDLQTVIEGSLYILQQPSLIDEEIYNNMWALTFSDSLITKLEVTDLAIFLDELLKKRNVQVSLINPQLKATFYFWFDRQALQLRFNIISGDNGILPFNCTLNVLSSPESIFKDFVITSRTFAIEGDDVEFFDSDEDPDDEVEEEYILDVYTTILN